MFLKQLCLFRYVFVRCGSYFRVMRLLRLALLVSRLPQRFVYKIGNYVTSVTLEKAHASCYATFSGGRAWLGTSHQPKIRPDLLTPSLIGYASSFSARSEGRVLLIFGAEVHTWWSAHFYGTRKHFWRHFSSSLYPKTASWWYLTFLVCNSIIKPPQRYLKVLRHMHHAKNRRCYPRDQEYNQNSNIRHVLATN
jgi:hypothetical protein